MNEFAFYEDLLGLPNLKITKIEKTRSKYVFHCIYLKTVSTCPVCLEPTGKINQKQELKFRDLKISEREVWLHVRIPQFYCPTCKRYFFDHPDWVMKGKSYTKRQSKWMFEMCKKQSFTQAGALLDMCPKTLERLFYPLAEKSVNLDKRYGQVRKLGIDELSHKKGKKDYVCVLTDLERGIQLDVLPNRKKETLIKHFESLGDDFCQQIEVVSCDIWKTYINVAKKCFPNAEIVIDRFHVVKALNEVLDTQRKQLRSKHKEEDCFKHIKWKLFKRAENCSSEDYSLLQQAFKKSWLLEEIYELRNTFNVMFDRAVDSKALTKSLHSWIQYAQKLNYEPLNKFIKTLKNWKKPIANFANEHISNAVTEGLNNFLRYFKRIAFGLPNFKHMRLRILSAST
jgi:transposase